ncbi:DUF89 domain-containing protein [Desulfatiferula olefinivorans]
MQSSHDCIPCFVRQALEAARFATEEDAVIERVLREVLKAVSEMDLSVPPPVMARDVHRIIRRCCGCDDPYRPVKERFNAFALGLYPSLRKRILDSNDPFDTAVRLAIAGNIIDFGVNAAIDGDLIHTTIDHALCGPLAGDVRDFEKRVNGARRILYLGDNAGEIVFDRLLIETLPNGRVTFVVRGRPVINDITMDDAEQTGMTACVPVIDNGSDAPGTVLSDCSDAFKAAFDAADLIIAKGQGNYESLSDLDRPIVFLLKAKCPVIAGHLNCQVGDTIIRSR